MSENWAHRTAWTFAREGLGTVVSLGRVGRDLVTTLPANAAQQILLLEPDRKQRTLLQDQHKDRATVLQGAFSTTDGTATLHCFSMKECDALRTPSGLTQLFPGLRPTGTREVETLSAATLLTHISLEDDRPHLLILGAPGEELSALTQLGDLGVLDRFVHVITPLPALPLYDGAADGPALLAPLQAAGFQIVDQDLSDPDRPLAWLRRDPALEAEREKIRALTREGDALQQRLDANGRAGPSDPHRKPDSAALDAELSRLAVQLEILQAVCPVTVVS